MPCSIIHHPGPCSSTLCWWHDYYHEWCICYCFSKKVPPKLVRDERFWSSVLFFSESSLSTLSGDIFSHSKSIFSDILGCAIRVGSPISDSPSVSTSMKLNLKLHQDDGDPLSELGRFRELVDSLIFLSATNSDICHAVYVLSQFVSATTSIHYVTLLMFFAIFVARWLNPCFFSHILYLLFDLIQMLVRQMIKIPVVSPQTSAFFLDHHLFLGTVSVRTLSPTLVPRQNIGWWPALPWS